MDVRYPELQSFSCPYKVSDVYQTYAIRSYIHTHHKNRGNRSGSSTISWRLVLKIVANCGNRDHKVIVTGNRDNRDYDRGG